MIFLTTLSGGIELVGLLFICLLILAASYFTTKWIGKHSLVNGGCSNISIVESYRLAPNECIQIVKAGSKYFLLGVTKEHIELLAELDEEDILINDKTEKHQIQFHEILGQAGKKFRDAKSKKDKR